MSSFSQFLTILSMKNLGLLVKKMEVFYYYFPDLLLPYLLFVQNWYCQGFSNSETVHRCKFCTILNLLCMGIHIGVRIKK